jgi:hypothetical protein
LAGNNGHRPHRHLRQREHEQLQEDGPLPPRRFGHVPVESWKHTTMRCASRDATHDRREPSSKTLTHRQLGRGHPIPHLQHLHIYICTGTQSGLAPATAAPGLGSPLPTSAPGLGSPCHICAGTGAHPAHICTGTGLTPTSSAPGLGSPGFMRRLFGSVSMPKATDAVLCAVAIHASTIEMQASGGH